MHVLSPFVEQLRARHPGMKIPGFDPRDGASAAKVLLLLEAPGPGAVRSGFISRHNNDLSARRLNELLAEAGIDAQETALWNVVPWYIGNEEGTKIRPARVADLRNAGPALGELLPLFRGLRAVVLVGRKAQHKVIRERIHATASGVKIFECYHPSPLVLNGRPENRAKILAVLQEVRAALGPAGST